MSRSSLWLAAGWMCCLDLQELRDFYEKGCRVQGLSFSGFCLITLPVTDKSPEYSRIRMTRKGH